MTIDVEAIRNLCEGATPGDWREGSVEKYHVFVECRDPECLGTERVLLKMNTHFDYEVDARFIAASRSLVPQLLAAYEQACRERDSYANSDFERQLAEAYATIERLRALLAEAVGIAERYIFIPPPYAPAAPTSIDGSVKTMTITIDPLKPYRDKTRLAEIAIAANLDGEGRK